MISRQDKIHIHENLDALSSAAAGHWCKQAQRAIAERDAFHVALSGGSTPGHLFQKLARQPLKKQIDWSKVHIYFGDERNVPPDHDDSNYRMARETLLQYVEVPPQQIHPIDTEHGHRQAADDYARCLERNIVARDDNGTVCLDLVMLGLGPDGHIASLFPDTDALRERERLVVPVYVEKFSTWRISLGFRVINAARQIQLLVSGAGKAEVVAEILGRTQGQSPHYPAEMLAPSGQLEWFLDQDAAARLETGR